MPDLSFAFQKLLREYGDKNRRRWAVSREQRAKPGLRPLTAQGLAASYAKDRLRLAALAGEEASLERFPDKTLPGLEKWAARKAARVSFTEGERRMIAALYAQETAHRIARQLNRSVWVIYKYASLTGLRKYQRRAV